MVATDGESVSVAHHDPYVKVGARRRQTRGDRRSAAVDAVHPEGVHVIGEARGASDTGDEDNLLGRDPELGHHRLHGSEDGVIPASGTPPDVLVRDEILARERADPARRLGYPPALPVGWARVLSLRHASGSLPLARP